MRRTSEESVTEKNMLIYFNSTFDRLFVRSFFFLQISKFHRDLTCCILNVLPLIKLKNKIIAFTLPVNLSGFDCFVALTTTKQFVLF